MVDSSGTIVVSLGGSLIVPDDVNAQFVHELRALVEHHIAQGRRFVIVTGGGRTARRYIDVLEREIPNISNVRLDWMGIYATRLNAQFLKVFFEDLAYKQIIETPEIVPETDKPVIFAAGSQPGWSTDYVAVQIAKTMGANTVINLSNIDAVYDCDPNTNKNAKAFKTISWEEYRKLIPEKWEPGLSSPFDPIASAFAEENNLKVIVMNGEIHNMKQYLEGQDFQGTIIS